MLAQYPPLTLPTFLLVSSLPPFLLLLELLSPASKRRRGERHRKNPSDLGWVRVFLLPSLLSTFSVGGDPWRKKRKNIAAPKKSCAKIVISDADDFSLFPKMWAMEEGRKGSFCLYCRIKIWEWVGVGLSVVREF